MARGRNANESPEDYAIRRAKAILREAFGSATIIVPMKDESTADTLGIFCAGHVTDARGHIWTAYEIMFEGKDSQGREDEAEN